MQQFALRAPVPAVPQAAARIRARARPLPASTQPASRRSLRPPVAARFRVSCAAAEAVPPPVSLRVVFSLRCSVEFGAKLHVVGSHDALGNCDVAQALPLTWSAGDIWSATAELPEHFVVRYKARVAAARKLRAQSALAVAQAAPPAHAPNRRSSSSSAQMAPCSGSRARTAQPSPAGAQRGSARTLLCRSTSFA